MNRLNALMYAKVMKMHKSLLFISIDSTSGYVYVYLPTKPTIDTLQIKFNRFIFQSPQSQQIETVLLIHNRVDRK